MFRSTSAAASVGFATTGKRCAPADVRRIGQVHRVDGAQSSTHLRRRLLHGRKSLRVGRRGSRARRGSAPDFGAMANTLGADATIYERCQVVYAADR